MLLERHDEENAFEKKGSPTKVESITGRWCQNHDNCEAIGDRVGANWRAKGLRLRPKPRPGEHTLTATLADDTGLAQQHGHKVAKGAESNQHVEAADSMAVTEDGLEEQTGCDLAGGDKRNLGHGRKIGNVGKDVQDGDDNQSNKSVPTELLDGAVDLVDNVKGIGVARVREDNLVQGVGQTVCGGGAFKRLDKVDVRISDARVTTENNQARDGDKRERDHLDDTDGVGEVVRSLCVECDNLKYRSA